MSLYSNLLTVLTPYANKIKQNEIDIRKAMSLYSEGASPFTFEHMYLGFNERWIVESV